MYNLTELQNELTTEYGLNCRIFPSCTAVTFFGSEIECLRLALKLCPNHAPTVKYSKEYQTWVCDFPYWFDADFANLIK